MTEQSVVVREPPAIAPPPYARSIRPWLWMSVAAAAMAAVGNAVALAGVDDIYGQETSAFVNQAIAQDVINLVVVCPAIVVLALLARRGSLRAYQAWLGAMSFVVYNYVIYTMSIHVGPLFLVWVAVLALALYALIGGLASLDVRSVKDRFTVAPRRTAGWFLIVFGRLRPSSPTRNSPPTTTAGTARTGTTSSSIRMASPSTRPGSRLSSGATSKLLPTTQKRNNDGWLSGTRDSQLPTAAAFGALTVRDPRSPLQRLQAGRIWQRMHLTATVDGLAMQPLCQIPERVDRETSAGLSPDFTRAMAAMLPADTHAVMTFRIGNPTGAAFLSPRRPIADVLRP